MVYDEHLNYKFLSVFYNKSLKFEKIVGAKLFCNLRIKFYIFFYLQKLKYLIYYYSNKKGLRLKDNADFSYFMMI